MPDFDAIMDKVREIMLEKGFLMNEDSFSRFVELERDTDRVEGLCGYPALAYIYAELGPLYAGDYWVDYVWFPLQECFPGYGFGAVNNSVLSIYREV